MNEQQQQLEALRDIRTLMERSSRFDALSGLAGVLIGIYALAGTAVFYVVSGLNPADPRYVQMLEAKPRLFQFLITDGLLVLASALMTGSLMAMRKARKMQLPLWDATARRLLINMLIPLFTGGIFCVILISHGHLALLAPVTLMFYGLALVNASKYSISDIRYLGTWEIAMGLLASYFIDFGLLFWALGFGLLHIVYGIAIYLKYEK